MRPVLIVVFLWGGIVGVLAQEPGSAQEPAVAGVELRGVVRSAVTHEPIDHATVAVRGVNRAAVSAADGEFRVTRVPEGTWRVDVSAPGFVSVSINIEVTGPTVRIEASLPPQPALHEDVVVTATGQPEAAADLPQSVSRLDREELRGTRGVGLDEVLNVVPGVRAESQAGTQEVRISIRGRGERTSFGVSGIRLLVDGMPETDPTGETSDLTGIDLAAFDSIEIVKGPMSGQYGASSSGVINLITPQGSATPWADFHGTFGSYGLVTTQAAVSGAIRPLRFFGTLSKLGQDGYRQHSRLDTTRFTGRADLQVAPDLSVSVFVRRTKSESELPGNLTQAQMDADRQQASALFVTYDARSDIDRTQIGGRVNKQWSDRGELTASGWAGASDFTVPVPFVILQGHRINDGANARYFLRHTVARRDASFSAGVDYQRTSEDRTDPANNRGIPGASVRNERRILDNVSAFASESVTLAQRFTVRVGVNRSDVGINVDDFLVTDGDQSGGKRFAQTSYFAGARYRPVEPATIYANVSTGFDPPTISAIGRSPDGLGGINAQLNPERSTNYEAGVALSLFGRVAARASAFHLRLQDEIVPTGVGVPQETFTNAAQTTHDGLEVSGTVTIAPGLTASAAYTFSSFAYDQFVNAVADVSGNQIPAVPRHRGTVSIRYRHRAGPQAGLDWTGNGVMFVNDANSQVNEAYKVTNAYAAYERPIKHLRFGLRYRVDNVFAAQYSAYVVVNDRFRGYYYPSPGRNHTIMVTSGWGF